MQSKEHFSAELHRKTLQLHLVLPADFCIKANQLESKPHSSRIDSRDLHLWCADVCNKHSSKNAFEHSDLMLKEQGLLFSDFSSLKKQFWSKT